MPLQPTSGRMTTEQLWLFNGFYFMLLVVVAVLTRATARRIAGALAGGLAAGVTALGIVALGEKASVWSAVVAGGQAAAPVSLSRALRAHVKDERFGIVTSIRGLPLGVRDGLQTLFGTQTLDIAEPGTEFQSTDVIVNPTLPIRRLAVAGCSTDHCLVYYERGGIARTWLVALFHWTPAATRFESGGIAPGGLATIDEVRNAMLSGKIKGPTKFW